MKVMDMLLRALRRFAVDLLLLFKFICKLMEAYFAISHKNINIFECYCEISNAWSNMRRVKIYAQQLNV